MQLHKCLSDINVKSAIVIFLPFLFKQSLVINNLKDIRFNNNSTLEDLLINCDLLIIDDLGAEQKNEFCITELFNLLNKKLLLKKKMLISTNLSIADISNIYSERIYSRIIGEFKLCKFYCKDIRITLNLKR